jgi:hypothetical protein
VNLIGARGQKTPPLKTTPFADGTGSIGLPSGWKITEAYRGTVTCVGPEKQAVVLGMPWTILRPDSEVATLPGQGRAAQAMVGDIPTALREVLTKNASARLLSLRTRDAPRAFPNVPAFHAMYEYEQGGRVYAAFGYLTTLDYGPSSPSWQFYASAVLAPKPRFLKDLPTLLAMWKSWRPNGQPPKAGSESAKFDELLRENRENYERMQAEFRKLL